MFVIKTQKTLIGPRIKDKIKSLIFRKIIKNVVKIVKII